jgi:hypothetical protein
MKKVKYYKVNKETILHIANGTYNKCNLAKKRLKYVKIAHTAI